MAHPPPGATPDNTKEWERETWVARMASLRNFRHHVPGDIPTPDERQPTRGGAERRQRTARLRAGGREGTRAREGRAGARAGSPGAGGRARGGG